MTFPKAGNTAGEALAQTLPRGKRAEAANPPAKAKTDAELGAVDALQLALDLAGMIPGAGAIPDLINAAISLCRGDFVGALFSAGSAIPGAGDVAGAGKILNNADKYLDAAKIIEKKVLPMLPNSMRKKLEDYLAKMRSKIDELIKKDKAEAPRKSESKDNDGGRSQGMERGRCKLRPYRQGCPNGQTGHHVVPDHCFHMPASQGGGRYPGTEKITHANGLVICVGGTTKSTGSDGGSVTKGSYKGKKAQWFGALADHGKIHALMDAQEEALGAINTPKRTATLGELEDAGARSAGLVTGCDPKYLKRQLREHHKANGLDKDTRLRADPFGRSPPPSGTTMGTGQGRDFE